MSPTRIASRTRVLLVGEGAGEGCQGEEEEIPRCLHRALMLLHTLGVFGGWVDVLGSESFREAWGVAAGDEVGWAIQ